MVTGDASGDAVSCKVWTDVLKAVHMCSDRYFLFVLCCWSFPVVLIWSFITFPFCPISDMTFGCSTYFVVLPSKLCVHLLFPRHTVICRRKCSALVSQSVHLIRKSSLFLFSMSWVELNLDLSYVWVCRWVHTHCFVLRDITSYTLNESKGKQNNESFWNTLSKTIM